MSRIVIEPVKLRHLPALQKCFASAARGSFSYLEPPEREQIIKENDLWRLARAWALPKRIVLVAHRNNAICGYAIGTIDGGDAYLGWLYVQADMRGQNTGLKLIARVVREAQKHHAARLILLTYDHQRYYARQGFKHMKQVTSHGAKLDMMGLTIAHHDD